MNLNLVVLGAAFLISFSSQARGEEQAALEKSSVPIKNVVRISISPSQLQLGGMNRQQRFLVTAFTTDGRAVDITHDAKSRVVDARVASVSDNLLIAQTDGVTSLQVSYLGLEADASIVAQEIDSYPAIHFRNDIVPLFSKLACNSGGCHGKQSGQNGFKLSIFGFDILSDYDALVKEGRGRRVFPAAPKRSLLYRKATGITPHGGGARVQPDSLDAELLLNWIRQGMPWGDEQAATVDHLEVEPEERLAAMQSTQQILVTAVYTDGKRRDVTTASNYTVNAPQVASVDKNGDCLIGSTPGEAAITINYAGHIAAVRLIVSRQGSSTSDMPSLNNRIDEFVWERLKKLNIPASELCDDETFLRRLYVKTTGTLPTPLEVRAFLSDQTADKRNHAIKQVLDRPEFADYWAVKFADILMVDQATLGERGAYEFHHWLREQLAKNRPYDEWVRELITASGNSAKNGQVNFFRALRTPEDITRAVSQAFLGIRMDCAQCHHHPFDRWGQRDFFGMAGYFNGMKRNKLSDDREMIYHPGYQQTSLPLTKEVVPTKPPSGDEPDGLTLGDPRRHLAAWMTNRENPYFSRLIANRLWKNFLGRGLVEPEDDLRSSNPATNEPLLDYLAQQVAANDFDLKSIMRMILESRTFQLSSVASEMNRRDTQNHSHYLVHRMPAEVLLDAISRVTESPERFVGMPAGTRALQLWDNRLPSYFLDTFGRSPRKSACECGKSNQPTMSQALHLINAPEIETKIGSRNGRVARLIDSKVGQDMLTDDFCLAAFGRFPSDKERRIAAKLFAEEAPREAAEDFLWTLLNSYDFLFIQ